MPPIYLDNQATTRCDPRVVDAMLPFLGPRFGNPHSAEHAIGRDAETAVEIARAQIAALIGADPREILFTSGATEANNLAIKGAARHARRQGDPRRRVITLATEHPCVLETVRSLAEDGFEPIVLPVQPDGLLDPATLRDALAVPTLLVSAMAVNNEIGVIQDLRTLAGIAHGHGAMFHTDAAQAAGKIAIDVRAEEIDLLSVSGHKLYGPKGIGALFIRRRPRIRLEPIFSGGGQERGLRSGTVAPMLAVGLGTACAIAAAAMQDEASRLRALHDHLLQGLRTAIPGLVLNGHPTQRIPGNLNLIFPAAQAAAIIAACPDLCLSTGSACASADLTPSSVLRAIGLSDAAAARSLRLGLGRFTSAAEVDHAIQALTAANASQG